MYSTPTNYNADKQARKSICEHLIEQRRLHQGALWSMVHHHVNGKDHFHLPGSNLPNLGWPRLFQVKCIYCITVPEEVHGPLTWVQTQTPIE